MGTLAFGFPRYPPCAVRPQCKMRLALTEDNPTQRIGLRPCAFAWREVTPNTGIHVLRITPRWRGRLLAGKPQRRGIIGFGRAQPRFLAADIVAGLRHRAFALRHLDLEHDQVAFAERHFR